MVAAWALAFLLTLQHAIASLLPCPLGSQGLGKPLRGEEKGSEREREIREEQLSKLMAMPCC